MGSHTLTFQVSDGQGHTDDQSVTIAVTAPAPVNQPPELASIGDKSIEAGQTLSFALSATDPDGDALTYSVSGNPTGSSLSGNTFSWQPTASQVGSHTLTFQVSDGQGHMDSQSITIEVTEPPPVNQPPVLATVGDKSIEAGQTLSFALSATDPDGDALTYSVSDNPQDSLLAGNLFTWQTVAGQAGLLYTLTFQVSDGQGHVDDQSITIVVTAPAPGNQPPVLATIGDKSLEAGQTLSFALSATDPDGDALTYSVSDNPQGSSLAGDLFTWQTLAGQVGLSYTLVFTVNDGQGGTDSQSVTISITPVNHSPILADILDRETEEGKTISFELKATDADDDPLTFSVSGQPPGSILSQGTFSWTTTSGQAGSYTMTFAVSDDQGESDSQSVTINVNKANRNPIFADITDQEVQEGETLRLTLKGTDADGDSLRFGMSGNPAGSTLSGSTFSWTPSTDQVGDHAMSFTVSDGRGGIDSQSITVKVLPANHNPQLVDLGDKSIQAEQTLIFDISATDQDGDELSYIVTDNPPGSTFLGQVFSWTPKVDQTGSYTVTFTVNDNQGGTDSRTIDITVNEKPRPIPSSVGLTITPTVPFENSEVEVQIDVSFTSQRATILEHSSATDGSEITISLVTGEIESNTPDSATTPLLTISEKIGLLEEGDYTLIITANGEEVRRQVLQVRGESSDSGLITMDFNLAEGNQKMTDTGNAKTGKEYQVQLCIKDLRMSISGWSITIRFDPNAIGFVSGGFEPSDYIPGLIPLEDSKEGSFSIGGTVLGRTVEASGEGELGTLSFTILDGFEENTQIFITENNVRFPEGGSEKYDTYFVSNITEIASIVGDFNGDGKVDFDDFFAFADAFGGDDPEFDFDGSGLVDFTDFFTFADQFGNSERAKLIKLAERYIGLPHPAQIVQSYPNPFNSSTTIDYSIQTPRKARLCVLNTAGQTIKTLSQDHHRSGSHRIVWDGSDSDGRQVSSGVYILMLQAEETTDIRKITFVK